MNITMKLNKVAEEIRELIDQRQNGGAPVNFESNNDSLDGLDMGEFGGR